MSETFRLPDVGEGLTEAEIVTWRVAPGDTVTVNQILVEIETAKAVVELPSPWAGTVESLLVEAGVTVEVGAPIIAVDTGSGSASAAQPAAAESQGAKIGEAGADGRIATLVGYGPRQGSVTRRPRKQGGAAAAQVGPTQAAAAAPALDSPDLSPDLDVAAPSGRADAAGRGADAPGHSAAAGEAGSLVPLAKPPVRKLAKDLGVDLRTIAGSGTGGIITREDVHAAAAGPANGAAVDGAAALGTATAGLPTAGTVAAGSAAAGIAAAGTAAAAGSAAAAGTAAAAGSAAGTTAASAGFVDGVRREPIRGVRKATAEAMVRSAFTAPHVTEFLTVDVTPTMELLASLKQRKQFADVRLTPLVLVAKMVCLAARRTPSINAGWDEAAGEIVYHEHVQLGIAAATPRGLVVPKVRDADRLDLHDLAAALGELTATARAGKTAPADLTGGTFTITNVGVFGVDTGTPILNPGEAGILALGSIKPAPWVVDGELAVRQVCQLALSFDHRLVDGEQGSRFLADVGALLQDPTTALLW